MERCRIHTIGTKVLWDEKSIVKKTSFLYQTVTNGY